jgi:hypothetical protein
MSSSYQASQTHVKYKASKGSPKPTKVVSSGKGNFVPSKSDCSKAGQSMAGKPGKGFSGKGTC